MRPIFARAPVANRHVRPINLTLIRLSRVKTSLLSTCVYVSISFFAVAEEDQSLSHLRDELTAGHTTTVCRELFLDCADISTQACTDAVREAMIECPLKKLAAAIEEASESDDRDISTVNTRSTEHGECLSARVGSKLGIDTIEKEACLLNSLREYAHEKGKPYEQTHNNAINSGP